MHDPRHRHQRNTPSREKCSYRRRTFFYQRTTAVARRENSHRLSPVDWNAVAGKHGLEIQGKCILHGELAVALFYGWSARLVGARSNCEVRSETMVAARNKARKIEDSECAGVEWKIGKRGRVTRESQIFS